MILKDKQVISAHQPGRSPVCEFVSYVHPLQPILMRRMGLEVGNDVHDELTDSYSFDNGQSWSTPRPAYQSCVVEGGYLVHTEAAILFHDQRNVFVTVTNEKLELSLEECDSSSPNKLSIQVGSPLADGPEPPALVSNFGLSHYACVSFSVPILDSRGRILVPIQWQKKDEDGSIARQGFAIVRGHPETLQDVWESALLIGEFESKDTNEICWHVGGAVPYEFQRTSRGLFEGTVTELPDGRLAMISRGSNAAWPEKPGYKWLSFSEDGGVTWSMAEPLACDDGSMFQSGSSGSLLFRSLKNGKLYWMGNLCKEGQQAAGNNPRSPLSICEVQEEPFCLKKSTLFHIDGCTPHEISQVEHSNFKAYQDRVTGELVFYLTRYGENGREGKNWMNADQYQYRVSLDES